MEYSSSTCGVPALNCVSVFSRLKHKQVILKTSWPRGQLNGIIRVHGELKLCCGCWSGAGDADDADGADGAGEAGWRCQRRPPPATLTLPWTRRLSVPGPFSSPPNCHEFSCSSVPPRRRHKTTLVLNLHPMVETESSQKGYGHFWNWNKGKASCSRVFQAVCHNQTKGSPK